jgi:hypothetical protein
MFNNEILNYWRVIVDIRLRRIKEIRGREESVRDVIEREVYKVR